APAADTRAVADHLDGDVPDRVAGAAHAGGGLGEHGHPGCTRPLGLGRAEVAPEVAESGGRQERVAHGVRAHVAVGVSGQPLGLVGPVESAEVEGYPLGEAVDVDADTRSHFVRTSGHGPDHARATIALCGRVRGGRWPVSWPASVVSPRRT